MVILRLMGGLGNQMFQYAAGVNLARRLGTRLLIDSSDFATQHKRRFALDCFCLGCDDGEILLDDLGAEALVRSRPAWTWLHARKPDRYYYFRERQFHYDPYFERVRGNVVLVGHWNSERYFAGSREAVVAALQLKPELERQLDPALCARVASGNSVALHVRRGDYVQEAKVAQVHGFIGLDYYRDAVAALRARVANPVFYLFSDDKEWVREHFSWLENHVIIDVDNRYRDYEDLALMARCRHNIIANSTFSWWSAYLNRNPDKCVIAPRQWFRDRKKNTRDLYVKDWTIV